MRSAPCISDNIKDQEWKWGWLAWGRVAGGKWKPPYLNNKKKKLKEIKQKDFLKTKEKIELMIQKRHFPLIEDWEPMLISVLLPYSLVGKVAWHVAAPILPTLPLCSVPRSSQTPGHWQQKCFDLLVLSMNQVIFNSVFNFQFHQNPQSRDELVCACEHQAWRSWHGLDYALWGLPETLWWLFLFFISDVQSKLFKIHLPVYAINSFIADTFPEDGSVQCPFSRRPCSLSNFGHNTNCTD